MAKDWENFWPSSEVCTRCIPEIKLRVPQDFFRKKITEVLEGQDTWKTNTPVNAAPLTFTDWASI